MARVLKFQKAKPTQAKLKLGLYGPQGSGKTLTALLIAEGLINRMNAKLPEGATPRRIAFVDTEQGYSFYTRNIPERKVHPEAFDFDAVHTRSIEEAVDLVSGIDTDEYGVLILDSITHFWDAAKDAYSGPRTSTNAIPIQAWGKIKRPYKQLMEQFLNKDLHAILCGREAKEVADSDDGGIKVVGTKIKAEGETGYEPQILGKMSNVRDDERSWHVEVYFEKDRSGILAGRTIRNPSFKSFETVLDYLTGDVQGRVETGDEAAAQDAAMQAENEERARRERDALRDRIHNKLVEAATMDELRRAWEETKGNKKALGDYYDQLEVVKDARRQQLRERAAEA